MKSLLDLLADVLVVMKLLMILRQFVIADRRGYEYSIFNKIPSGMIRMNWTGDYGIDLVLYLKRREAAW